MAVIWQNDFEDGTLQDFAVLDNDFQIVSNPARGSYSAGISTSADKDIAYSSPSELSGGLQLESFEFWYNEDSGSHGGGVALYDNNQNEVIGFATSNPDWCIHDQDGWEELGSNDGDYNVWIKVKIIFDWSAGTATIEGNQDGGSVYTYADRPLINNTNIESIYFKGFANTGDGWESGTIQEMWIDDFVAYGQSTDPSVTTNSASAVTENSATLNGTLEDLGGESSVDVYFEWGTTTSYGNTTTVQTLSSTGAFSDSISGLTADQTYHSRAAVTDGMDTWYGADVQFTATDAEPTAEAGQFFMFPF